MHTINLNAAPSAYLSELDRHRHLALTELLRQPTAIFHDRFDDHSIRWLPSDERTAMAMVDTLVAGDELVFDEPTKYAIVKVGDQHLAAAMLDDSTIDAVIAPIELNETGWPEPATGLLKLVCHGGVVIDGRFVCEGKIRSIGVVMAAVSTATRDPVDAHVG